MKQINEATHPTPNTRKGNPKWSSPKICCRAAGLFVDKHGMCSFK